jgi:hypothetical protein
VTIFYTNLCRTSITAGGDIYCFVYKEKNKLTHIILYENDTDDIVSYGLDFEEFLMWQMHSASANWDQEIEIKMDKKFTFYPL